MSEPKDYIGGALELDLLWLVRPPSQNLKEYFGLDGMSLLLASGRGAFGAILDDLSARKKIVLVPDFLCGDVMLPRLEERNIDYRYYPVMPDLSVDEDALWALMEKEPDAILFVNYFGLCDWGPLAREIRDLNGNVSIIIDNVQALYDRSGHTWADYGFSSFRKFLSVPDGAFGWGREPFASQPEPPPSIDSGAPYLVAATLRHAFLKGFFEQTEEGRIEETYLGLFAEAAARVPTNSTAMSAFSKTLVDRLPLDEFATQRRENYRYLSGALAAVPELTILRPELPEDSVPLALPALAPKDRRDDMIAYLRECGIFCPVHWPLTDNQRQNGGAGCRELAGRIISFPVDQRYDPDRLERVVGAVTDYWRSK